MRLLHIGRRLLLPALVIFAITGCQLMQGLGEPKVIKSGDGRFQVTVPAAWREDPALHPTAGIRASNRLQELYVIVISESKEDFPEDMTLEQFTTITRDGIMKKVGSPQASPPAPITVADVYPGIQYGVQGEMSNKRVAYLATNVETPTDFHQIIAWTLGARIGQNETTLSQVTNTFRANY